MDKEAYLLSNKDKLIARIDRNVKNFHDAESIFYYVFEKFLAQQQDYVNDEHIDRWLSKVITNEVRRYFKHRKAKCKVFDNPPVIPLEMLEKRQDQNVLPVDIIDENNVSPLEMLQKTDTDSSYLRDIKEIMDRKLSKAEKQLVTLRFFNNMEIDEIAKIMCSTERRLRVMLCAAKLKIKKASRFSVTSKTTSEYEIFSNT